MELTSEYIKKVAKSYGADIVGIGNIERWDTAPIQMDPKQIMPRAKSIIAMGFRVFRGSLRGIEEGTYFSNYSAMGYGGITYLYMPMTVLNTAKVLEDAGYEAVPMGHQSDWRAIDNKGVPFEGYSRPVAPGKAMPDVMVHMRIAGFLCGLGEIGYSKMLLTPEFGPRVRVGIIITEAPLEPDPIIPPGTLCNRCMACARNCPAHAISMTETVKTTLAGYEVEWGKLNEDDCDMALTGAEVCKPGQLNYDYRGEGTRPSSISPFFKKPRSLYNTGQAVCGARGCTRACMITLEKRGVLKNKFVNEFRTQKPWTIDWPDEILEKELEERETRKYQVGISFLGVEQKAKPDYTKKLDKDDVD